MGQVSTQLILPLMQSLRGRCFDVMTCNELWICAILTTGCPGI